MQKTKHSKYKNSRVIFESLVNQIASDILSNKEPYAVGLVKKYYSNTELAKEHKLYETLLNYNSLSESKADNLISTVLKLSEKINRTILRNEKYNLIKEIKEKYNIDTFFKSKISNYKTSAAIYNLLESHNNKNFIDPTYIINNKSTLLEFLTHSPKPSTNDSLLEEYSKYERGDRMLVYEMLVKNFNSQYSTLLDEQKNLLREYINNVSNNSNLKEYINIQISNIKEELSKIIESNEDVKIKIKLNEVNGLLNLIPKSESANDDDVLNLMNYYDLINELKNA